MRRLPTLVVAVAVLAVACSDSSRTSPTSSTTVVSSTTAAEASGDSSSPPASAPTSASGSASGPEVVAPDETLAAPTWQPSTRSEELLVALASGEEPTVQQAVDAFSVTYAPMPGATPSALPPGDGIGADAALALIESKRDQLTDGQRAVLDAIDASVVAAAPDSAGTPDTLAPGAHGVVARRAPIAPTPDQLTHYDELLGEVIKAWKQRLPGVQIPIVLQEFVSFSNGTVDMDTLYPWQKKEKDEKGELKDPTLYCHLRFFPHLYQSGADDDDVLRIALAHEVFHCIQSRWQPGTMPSWLIEGSATFAGFDLYRGTIAPPKRYFFPDWWKQSAAGLTSYAHDAWPLFESFQQFGGNVYAKLESAIKSVHGATPADPPKQITTKEWLTRLGMDGVLFRARWSTYSLRSTAFPEPEWSMQWPTTPAAGPHDTEHSLGTRGPGVFTVTSATNLSQQQLRVTMADDVGFVVLKAMKGPVFSHTDSGTAEIPEGHERILCFDEVDRCTCPEGLSAHADDVTGHQLYLSFPATDEQQQAVVVAQKWDPAKDCENDKLQHASSNGDPHLVTFDGLRYDLMARGEFVLARDPAGGFEVQVRQQAPSGTVTTAVATRVGDHRVVLSGDPEHGGTKRITVDGAEVADVSAPHAVGDGSVAPAGDDAWTITWADGSTVTLRWHAGWFVDVAPAGARLHRLVGLLGSANERFTDDLTLPDGTVVDPTDATAIDHSLAPAWYVTTSTTLFDYAAGESVEGFRAEPPPPPDISTDQRATCAAALPVTAGDADIEACAFDTAATGDDYTGIYTTVVAAAAQASQVPIAVATNPAGTGSTPATAPGPTAGGPGQLVLQGALYDGLVPAEGAVDTLTGSIDIAQGSVVVVHADGCHGDEQLDVILSRPGGTDSVRLNVCDPFGLNAGGTDDEKVPGEVAAWVSAGGSYDVAIRSSSDTPVQTRVTLMTDTSPTLVDAATAMASGWSGTLHGVADTVVLLVHTTTSVGWTGKGLDRACAIDAYGASPPGEGLPTSLGICPHKAQFFVGPTGDAQVVPIVVWSRIAGDVEVALTPTSA